MATQISGAIFLHIPKCGGTWVRNYLNETKLTVREIEPEHINAHTIREKIDPTEDIICCFVRHPLTWYASYWQHRQQLVTRRDGGPIDNIVDLPFTDFIEGILKDYPGYLSKFFDTYTNRCRFIGKQETLRDDLNVILSGLKIKYNQNYLYTRVLDNVTEKTAKYPYSLAKEIMITEKAIIDRYNYNYIPTEVLE